MTRRADAAPAPCLPVEEVARLDALATLGSGAAHAINNALTTLLGEAHFLRDERKTDDAVVEACDAIVLAVERCARITRGVALRRDELCDRPDGEIDIATHVRSMTGVLRETLGSRVELDLTLASDLPFVRGSAQDVDLLLLSLLHYAAETAQGATRLGLELAPGPETDSLQIRLSVSASEVPGDVAEALQDPSRASGDRDRTRLEAIALVLAAHGGDCHAGAGDPGEWHARIQLPVVAQDA